MLIAGDAILASDVPWINHFLDGDDALETAIATVERIGNLDARVAVAGHPAQRAGKRIVSSPE